jgi:hypothetical protein
MAEATGHPCPECGVPREPDNTPSCVCAQRASDALRDARTAKAAAAEDFDPLRIRPYVELTGPAPQAAAEASPRELPTVGRQVPPAEATIPLRAAPPGAVDTASGASGAAPGAPGATAGVGGAPGAAPAESGPGSAPGAPSAVPGAGGTDPQSPDPGRTSVLPTPPAPPTSAPSDTDLRLFEAAEVEGAGPEGGDARPRRRRRGLLLGAAAAGVVAVVAAAGYASGLFSYETPTRDSALPSDLRASVPDVPADAPSETASTSASPSASQTSASPSASVGESASPSPSPSRSSASPSPSTKPAEQSAPAPTVTATGTLSSDPDDDRPAEGAVLRRGDRGPEVTELQLRLGQVYLYTGEANGRFNNQVEDALRTYQWSRGVETGEGQLGVYGPDTRRSLESETREP